MSLPCRSLVLNGFMATGKSTLAPLVAGRVGVGWVDVDAVVEERAGRSIGEVFAGCGEAGFRVLEAEALRAVLEEEGPRVISVGGGALVDAGVRAHVLAQAHVVTLTARPETVLERVQADGRVRPLLEPAPSLGRIRELLAARAAAYAEAHAVIATDGLAVEEVAEAVVRSWEDPTLVLPLGVRSYPVRVTRELSRAVADVARSLSPSAVFVVTDENVAPLALEPVVEALRSVGLKVPATVVLVPGEQQKQLAAVERILKALVEAGADRQALVVALGGGVVSDVAGFAASALLRGVRWVAVPTTLLSMVDAAVGGKTGVDLGLAKNAVGAFHQPSAVLIDPGHVRTESMRAYVSGLAEVVKSGAIADPGLLGLLEAEREGVLGRDLGLVREMVLRAVRVKTEIVMRDEREVGDRVLLNFGHTVGHGLEAAGGFARLTHGEAVSLGMVAILRVGRALGVTQAGVEERIQGLLEALGLPTRLDAEPMEEGLRLAALDKKRVGAGIRVVLLEEVGRPRVEVLSLDTLRGILLDRG